MPKQKITREMVVGAAFELARERGMEKVTVKSLAEKLGCSVQPIYSYCVSMEGLQKAVAQQAEAFIREYLRANICGDDLFRSTGFAYIRLASEEPHIFRLFIRRERQGITSLEDLYSQEASPHMAEFLSENLKISLPDAKRLHLNMLIYTMGLGTILTSLSPGIPQEEVRTQLELAQMAFLGKNIGGEEN